MKLRKQSKPPICFNFVYFKNYVSMIFKVLNHGHTFVRSTYLFSQHLLMSTNLR